jgi:hypothetical protein
MNFIHGWLPSAMDPNKEAHNLRGLEPMGNLAMEAASQ